MASTRTLAGASTSRPSLGKAPQERLILTVVFGTLATNAQEMVPIAKNAMGRENRSTTWTELDCRQFRSGKRQRKTRQLEERILLARFWTSRMSDDEHMLVLRARGPSSIEDTQGET
jgi:hypothetical protein